MTGEDLDPRLHDAITQGFAGHAPDGLLERIVQRTASERQRPTWQWSALAVTAAALATALVVVLVTMTGMRIGPSQGGGASPHAVASAAHRPSIPIDGSCQPDATCLGILQPGSVSTRVFSPALAFQTPAGWMNRVDQGGVFELRPIKRPQDVIGLYRHPEAIQSGRMVLGVKERADALIAFLLADRDVTVTSVHQVTVGGLSGMVADVLPTPAVAATSLDCPGAKCVTILSGIDPAQRPVWGYRTVLPENSRTRLYLLDAADGVVLIQVTAWDAATFDELLAAARPIVDSFRFTR